MRKPIDFSIIGEVPQKNTSDSLQQAELVGLEITTLEQSKADYESKLRVDKIASDLADLIQNTTLRKNFSRQILIYLWVFSAFCAFILLIDGFHVYSFSLPTSVLVTLVGGTAASAFGLVSVVLGGLFKDTPGRNKKSNRAKRVLATHRKNESGLSPQDDS